MIKENLKNNKGITLVALIITIIVLLILAMVTIKAIKDDSLIVEVEAAKKEYQAGQEKEELVLLQNEWELAKQFPGKTYASFMQDKLGDMEKVANVQVAEDGALIVTMQSGNKFKLEENKEVEIIDSDEGEDVTTLSELERYIYGVDGEGRDVSEIVNGTTFIQDSTDLTSTIHNKMEFLYVELNSDSTFTVYLKCNGSTYSFDMTADQVTIKDSLVLVTGDIAPYELAYYILGPATGYVNQEGIVGFLIMSEENDDYRLSDEIFDWDTDTFKQDPADPTSTIHEDIEVVDMKAGQMQIEYKEKTYYIIMKSAGNGTGTVTLFGALLEQEL